ncbi:glycine-rich domain-containing protein [Pantoea agglomerans]|uniref:glycine-rich domain-containing protein n=1 Tax=Enterobacter agglomerans TaxID=549 RepID=UPI001CBE52F2|nr:carbohydrate kinase [Pantoea agglomerans]
MHRIDTSTAQVDKFGAGKNGFTGGNPQTGELPTALDADFFDSVQEEIAAVIESAGIALDKSKNNQLAAAIKSLFGAGRLIGVKVFATPGTFTYTKSPGAKKARVFVTGAGGSGARGSSATAPPGAGGGAGGTAIKLVTLTQDAYTLVVGARAVGGSPGGSSSFGTECAATGGGYATGGGGGAPGVGSGGDINLSGGYGSDATDSSLGGYGSGDGGASYWGGGRKAGTGTGQSDYGAPGSGGGGNQAANTAGQNMGAPGIIYLEEYS